MKCLVLRLAGPMQSWGVQSRFTERDTDRFPTKSGVIGLLCAALGRDRAEAMDDLAALEMGVRIDRDGVFSRDYQTAGGGKFLGQRYGVLRASGGPGDTVLSNRYYLADAEFLVALAGDENLLVLCATQLSRPHWPLYLGRKSFVPTPPLSLGLHTGQIRDVLRALPWRKRTRDRQVPQRLRLIVESGPGEGAARMDTPVSFQNGNRQFLLRHLRSEWCADFPVIETMEEVFACISQD